MPQEIALAKQEPQELAKVDTASARQQLAATFRPTNLTEAIALSKLMARSEMVPKDFRGKPDNILIAMQMGAEVGLAPMQALQNIAVINGRPSLWGDAALAIVVVHKDYQWHKEGWEGTGENKTAVFQILRRGHEVYTSRFSVADAKKAGLWTKDGPWKNYPDRMLQMRARGFGIRDKFPDALRGLGIAEESMDIAPESSEGRREREKAIFDMGISGLTPSTEPNRGHGNEGMQRAKPEKKEDTICAECRQVNGHTESCSQTAKAAQDAKTSKPTTKQVFMLLDYAERVKKDSKEPYLILEVVAADDSQGKLYVWHQSIFEYLRAAKGQTILCEISQAGSGGKTFHQLEHLLEVAGVPFVNDKPAEQAAMPADADCPKCGLPHTGDCHADQVQGTEVKF